MPEASSYTFSHTELLEHLIKAADVHEGKWMLQVNFGFSAGNFGADENSVSPGAVSVINHVGISRAKDDAPKNLVLDAAEVNPKS